MCGNGALTVFCLKSRSCSCVPIFLQLVPWLQVSMSNNLANWLAKQTLRSSLCKGIRAIKISSPPCIIAIFTFSSFSHVRAIKNGWSAWLAKRNFMKDTPTETSNVLENVLNSQLYIFIFRCKDWTKNAFNPVKSKEISFLQSQSSVSESAKYLSIFSVFCNCALRCLGSIYTWRRICQRIVDEYSTNTRRILNEEKLFADE